MKSALELFREIRSGVRPSAVRVVENRPPEAPTEDISPAGRLNADWQAAVTRARDCFARHGTEPSAETFKGAAALEFGLADGTLPRPGATAENIRNALDGIYAGRSAGRLAASGRVAVYSLPDPSSAVAPPKASAAEGGASGSPTSCPGASLSPPLDNSMKATTNSAHSEHAE